MNCKQRLVLELLAASGPRGRVDSMFLARFTLELLDLVRNGFATAWPASVRARGQKSHIARISITDEGRRVLERGR
jgi:hypothetical protein